MALRRPRRLGCSGGTGPLKVVVVEPTLEDNGAIRVSLDRAARWQALGASVVVFVVEHADGGRLTTVPAGVEVRWATAVPRRLRWALLVGGARLWWMARRADVLVAGREIGLGLLLTAVVAPLARRPFSVTVQSRPDVALTTYLPRRMHGITRQALARADQAVCVAAGMVPSLVALGLHEGRAHVVTNGVDVDAVQLAARAPSHLGDADGPVLVGTGRLAHQKGFDLLVRAHALALAAGAPAHSVVVLGEGPDRAGLQQLAQELGVQDSVRFPGHVDNPHAVVARADGFVLPSRWEGFPLALVEALCCGTPCIAADCVSGPSEVLDSGAFGQLVPVEDAQALAAAITAHLRDAQPLTARARAGQAAALERFAAGVAARDHLQLLQDLVRPSGDHSRNRLSPSRSADSTQSSVQSVLSRVGNWSSPPPKNQAENT